MINILIWFGLFLGLFTIFAVQQSLHFRNAGTAVAYATGDGGLAGYVYAPAATALSLTAWAVLIVPALVYAHGLSAAALVLAAITTVLTGAALFPRLQSLGKTLGESDPGQLLAIQHSARLRFTWGLIALLFAIPFIAVQLRGGGLIVHLLTDGAIPLALAILGLTAIPLAVALLGGLRAAASASAACFFLLFLGLGATAALAIGVIGSFEDFRTASAALAADSSPDAGLVALVWLMALLGTQASPALLTLALMSRSTRGFKAHAWLSAVLFGILLLIALPSIFIAAHMLGLDGGFTGNHPELVRNLLGNWAETEQVQNAEGLASVPIVIRRVALAAPWIVSFLGVCAIGAMLMGAAAEAAGGGATIVRALRREASAAKARACAAVLLAGGVALALTTPSIFALAGFALGAALQMLPALAALAFLPRIPGVALLSGQVIGLGVLVAGTFMLGDEHIDVVLPGLIGLAVNIFAVCCVSAFSRESAQARIRYETLRATVAQHWTARHFVSLLGIALLIGLATFADPIAYALFGQPQEPSTWTLGVPPMLPWFTVLWIGSAVLFVTFAQNAR